MALGQILTQSLSRNEQHMTQAARSVASSAVSSVASHSPVALSKNLNRLICAAVVSPRFRAILLSDPVAALAAGYNGENFQLTPAEYAAVTSLHVTTMRDFAAQLLRVMQSAAVEPARHEQDPRGDFHFAEIPS
jgi:hypothetical protein